MDEDAYSEIGVTYSDECDNCGELSTELRERTSGDESVGYRETQWLCPKCWEKARKR